MKRNQNGQFIQSWETEAKQKVSLSLTATAWEILDKKAHQQGLSKSELIERFARSLEDEAPDIQPVESNQLKAVVSTMTEGLVIADSTGNILEFNPAALSIHGFESLEQVQRHFSEFVDYFEVRDVAGNFVPLERWAMARVLQGERYTGYELQIHRTDTGTTFVGSYSGTPIYDTEGNISLAILTLRDITIEKQAQADLIRSQQFNQQVAEMLPGLLYVYDLTEQRNIYVNRESAELLGYTPEQIQAMGANLMAMLLHPSDLPKFIAAQEELRIKPDGESVELDYRMRRADGEWRWILDRAVVFKRTPDGQAQQVLGFAIDISDRKAAEEALQHSESRLRRIVDGELVGVLFWRIDGLITDANDVVLDLIGYSRSELEAEQLRWTELTPPGWETVDTIALKELATRGVCTPYEKEYYHKDGSRIPILIGFSALEENANEGVAFIVDIRDRKAAEIALRHSEERLKRALDAARMVAWEWSADTNQVIYSHTAVEVFGVESETEIRTSEEALALVHPDDIPAHQQAVGAAIATGESYVSSFRLIRPDNQETVWMEDRGNVLMDGDNTLTKVTGMIMDISERVRWEEERDRVFQQEQAAREAAEEANRIKDEFLMVLSHELRTPLNPILGWLKLLRAGRLSPEKTTEVLATIERNAQLQAQLIEDLLDVSKILRGKLTLDLKRMNLAVSAGAAIETVQLSAEAKNIAIHQQIENAIVLGDESRLQQVVWNLLSNAVKFTPENGQIHVSLTQVGEMAQIQVKDTGKGIEPDFLPYVFEHFRQQDSSTTRRFGGLGLGLAIVRQIAELHGGSVFAESEGEGKGATFTVLIPSASSYNNPV